jgi:Tol biopolymer transport system component
MTLRPGEKIASYEILGSLGQGGMGEVYRARDTRLGRDVALKVLPQVFAADEERVARLRREAQVLAAMNHEHIASIYGLEDFDGNPSLVLELVEGPTLADRLSSGALPMSESFAIARQIAEAIEAAHDRGIVHRDLKPANIKLRADGVVKVLDFGLAKLVEPPDGTRAGIASRTTISPAETRIGTILGTASYMSPEQARGLEVGPAADIWAWGCVLFEMLTGARAFDGADATDAIAAVVRGEPEWSRLPSATPALVRTLLRRCLEKDPKRRLGHIRDARFALEDAQAEVHVAGAPVGRRRERLAWGAALLLGVVAIAGGVGALRPRPPATGTRVPETRLEIATPPTTDPVSLAISPDGNWLAFVASSDGRSRLWLRSLRTGDTRVLPGTDGAQFPFWKPDSRSIGFFASERVFRIDDDGGSLRQIGRAPVAAGGTWSDRGTVLFTLVPDAGIVSVPESGGPSSDVPGWDRSLGGNRFPKFLPDGRHFLYYMAGAAVRGVYLGSVDDPERRRLFDADAAAVLMPPDEILFVRAGTLYHQRFDTDAFALVGEAVPLAQGIAVDSTGAAAVSASADRTIVFRSGAGNRLRQLAWFDRSGQRIGERYAADPDNAINPSLSPDERFVLESRTVDGNADVWLLDLQRAGALTRITTAPTPDIGPVWAPDGVRLAYAGGATGFDLYLKPAAAAGGDTLLRAGAGPLAEIPLDWSRDGKFILYRAQSEILVPSLFALAADGTGEPVTIADTSADERVGQFSPDGKWVVFESNESGRFEIYVQRFPGPGVKTLVSTAGGRQPRWSADGRELFYIAPDATLMAAAMRVAADGKTIEPGVAQTLFVAPVSSTPSGGSNIEYAVSRDGQRFLMDMLIEQAGQPVTVVLNTAR